MTLKTTHCVIPFVWKDPEEANFLEPESGVVIARGWRWRGMGKGCWVSFGSNEVC